MKPFIKKQNENKYDNFLRSEAVIYKSKKWDLYLELRMISLQKNQSSIFNSSK